MKNLGIITEYNPFHEGHAFQLSEAKKRYGAEGVIIVMSGDFTQRGAPAVMDKYTRAKTALLNGADIVLMMPSLFSVSSAEFFARSGVNTLIHSGVCDTLLFGSENDDIDSFKEVAKVLIDEPEEYKETLKEGLKAGLSFPLAREKAVRRIIDKKEFFLSSPNNILGLEYVKALMQKGSDIEPIAMKRVGAAYHDASIPNETGHFVSSSALRRVLENETKEDAIKKIKTALPESIAKPMIEAVEENTIINREDAALLLHEALLRTDDYTVYSDCSEELSNRIRNMRNEYTGFKALNDALKTKELTYSRISRVLTHIMLDIKEEDVKEAAKLDMAPYIRVLAMNENGEKILSEMTSKSDVPVILNVKEAEEKLSPDAYDVFKKDIYAADIFRALMTQKTGNVYPNEYTRKYLKV